MSDLSVTVKPNKTVVSSVTVAPQISVSLGNLTNVDASDPNDGETLVYDASVSKYVVKNIIVDSNNVTNINFCFRTCCIITIPWIGTARIFVISRFYNVSCMHC
mgnify:CR=1 FL=1